MKGEKETQLIQMMNVVSSFSSAPAVNMEIILEQGLGTRQEQKTRVGCTLSQMVHGGASSSSSRSDGSMAHVDLAVEEYLRRSYEQNLHMYASHQMM